MITQRRAAALALGLALAVCSTRSRALEVGDEGDPAAVQVHAFVSQGYILSSRNNYLVKSKSGSFEFAEVGINFTKAITERFRVGIQLFAHDLGTIGNYSATMDWFYLDYRFADWLGLRAGRVKIPFGLYNDINDIDAARNAILLPQSVYPIQNRDYLLAQTGAEAYGSIRSPDAGRLEYRFYGGTIFLPLTQTVGSPYQVLSLTNPYVVGSRLLWETPIDGLRMGGSVQSLRIDTTLLAPQSKTVSLEIPVLLWVGSLEFAAHDLLLAAEYSRWYTKIESTDSSVFPASPTVISERMYAMINYRIATWLQPGMYYSLLFPDADKHKGRANMQHDVAITFRYDLTTNWLLKLEAHYMVGTAALSPTINDNAPLTALQREWGVFLAKTTAYF